MAAKRSKKRKLKTSVKLFAAVFFVLIVCVTAFTCGKPKNNGENTAEKTGIFALSLPQPIVKITALNEFCRIKTVINNDLIRHYPLFPENGEINKAVASEIVESGKELLPVNAYFDQSFYSIVMRDKNGNTLSFNYSASREPLFLSVVAPDLFDLYGEVPFYLDDKSITLYADGSETVILLSEYDNSINLPYVPPVYTPAAEGEKVIALTFDDGPHRPDITRKILSKLKERRAKATFFVLGFECPDNGVILNEILKSGCEIGNHSWRHEKLNELSRADALASVTKTQNIVYEKTGVYPKVFRPPYGDERLDIMEELGLFHVEWCVDPEDWKVKDPAALSQHVKEKARSGYVVLMHDIYEASGEAALELIDWFCDNGWRLVTVSELFDFENREFSTDIFRMK
ncbi:MAG: hypothetical protein E7588_07615 [Ruminococcaceae bacterium]|nr:hypothetical protein [Oscillospiraceae bacterium]